MPAPLHPYGWVARMKNYCFIDDAIEGDGAGVLHQSNGQREGCREKRKRKKKKRYPRSPKPKVQPWQAQGSELFYVVNAGPGPANQNQLAWEACMVDDAALFDSTEGGMTEEVVESVWTMDSISRTPRRTLELAGRIGKRLVCMLIDSGATGNYISAQEGESRGRKREKEQGGKELTMADGSNMKTLG